jgi:hypothetical protein
VVCYLNTFRQIYLPHPYRARYVVIGIWAICVLNYYTPINISVKYMEGITLKKTVRGFYNNLYPLCA